MKQNVLLFFSFFFSLQTSCMIISHKHASKLAIRNLLKNCQPSPVKKQEVLLGQKEQNLLDMSQIITFDAMGHVIGNLDYKANMLLIMTCKTFYNHYAEKNDLFTHHCLNSNDYTGAMVCLARKNDAKKIELLMQHEGIDNKNNRENILTYFGVNHTTDPQQVIEIYKKTYDQENTYQAVDISELINHISVLQLLLKQGYDPNVKCDKNVPLFFYASLANIEALKLLLADSRLDPNIKDNNGLTALCHAAMDNNIEVLKLLLANSQVDPNIDIRGISILSCAASNNSIEVLKLLLTDKRIDPNVKDNNGLTVFCRAIVDNNIEVLKLLLANSQVDPNVDIRGTSVLCFAAFNNSIEVLKLLLTDKRIDPDVKDSYGLRVFHCAIFNNNIEVLRLLLADRRVNPNVRYNNGNTGIHFAVRKNNIDALKIVLSNDRVNPNIENNNGDTALHCAVEDNNIEALKFLLANNHVDPNVKNNQGITPLFAAIAGDCMEALRVLVASPRLDLNVKACVDLTALHFVVMSSNVEALKILLTNSSIDLNVKDEDGCTIDDLAKDPEIIKILSEHRRSFFSKHKTKILIVATGAISLLYGVSKS
jgi:ankyrin repeat protein